MERGLPREAAFRGASGCVGASFCHWHRHSGRPPVLLVPILGRRPQVRNDLRQQNERATDGAGHNSRKGKKQRTCVHPTGRVAGEDVVLINHTKRHLHPVSAFKLWWWRWRQLSHIPSPGRVGWCNPAGMVVEEVGAVQTHGRPTGRAPQSPSALQSCCTPPPLRKGRSLPAPPGTGFHVAWLPYCCVRRCGGTTAPPPPAHVYGLLPYAKQPCTCMCVARTGRLTGRL